MIKWISENIKYPEQAVKRYITGEVVVLFHVSSTGKVKNVSVYKAVDPILDNEAVRVISSMPDWKPGTQRGKPVDVVLKVPVNFRLTKNK
jgi:TonB family protein